MTISHPDKSTNRSFYGELSSPRRAILDLILITFIIIYGLIGMRNFDLRMANLHQDDGPILFSHAFKNPSLFEEDFQVGSPISLRTHFKVITSAIVWIPALLWHYLNIAPYPTTWLITLIQGLSMGLAIYILTLAMVRQRAVAILAVIFAYTAIPWAWDPANYGGGSKWTFTPYPAHLAIAPILLAFSCLIYGRNKLTLLLLAVAGLIHPNLTLYAIAIVGFYWPWEGIQNRSQAMWRRLAGLAVVGLITISPALWVRMTLSIDSLPGDEIIAGMRHNQHIWPWGYEGRWGFAVSSTLKWLVLAGLSWRWRAKFSNNVSRLWLATLTAVFIIGLSHIIGGIWQIPMLLNLIGLRSFMWLALISLPLVMYYWVAHIRSGHWLGAVLSLLCLALPFYVREYGLFWALIIGLLLLDASQGHLAIWNFNLPTWGRYTLQTIAGFVLIAWSVSFLAIPFDSQAISKTLAEALTQFAWGVMGAVPEQSDRVNLIVLIALLGLIIWGLDRLIRRRLSVNENTLWFALISLLIVIYGARFLWLNWQEAERLRVSSQASTLDVQLWAREHTPVSSLFVVPSPAWRTMSQRRKLSPFTRESYAYIAPRQTKEHRDHLLDFYGISAEEGRQFRGNQVYQMERDRFWDFKEDGFLRFASEFGATHLVLPTYYKFTETTELELPLVYENPYYVVYKLEDLPSLEIVRYQLETIMTDALLDLSSANIVTENDAFYIIAKTGQKIDIEGLAAAADGPRAGSVALVIEAQTRLNGPPSTLKLNQGSLSVWGRLTDPTKKYSDLVQVNNSNDLYIYHKGGGGFVVWYNGVDLGATMALDDTEWHHYVFTWQDGEQKFYLDGRQALSAEVPASEADTELFAIGWLGDGTDREQWGGLLADLITFNRPLSEDEVTALYRANQPGGD